MKLRNKFFCHIVFCMTALFICASGCQQTASTKRAPKRNLKIEIRNELENLQWIIVQVRDFENKDVWLDVRKIQEKGETSLLKEGKVYEQEFSIDKAVMEDIDTFEVEFSYQQKGKDTVVSERSSVSKDEWQGDKVRKYVIREQVTAVDNAVMPDLQIEVLNRISDVIGIDIEVSDKENTKWGEAYFTGVAILEDYNKEGVLLEVGKTYKHSIPGEAIQVREGDTIYLKVAYIKTSGELVEIGTFPVSKEECWNGKVQKIAVEKRAVVVPMEE